MDTYLLVPRHPRNYAGSPEAAAAWEAWFDKLGDALVDKGNAVLDGRGAVGKPGTVLPLGGYTIINAANLEEATQLARGCPALQARGRSRGRQADSQPRPPASRPHILIERAGPGPSGRARPGSLDGVGAENGAVALPVVAGCDVVTTLAVIDAMSVVGTVFCGLPALVIEDVEDAGEVIVVGARTRGGAAACPGCGTETGRVHGYHERTAAGASS